MIIFKKLSVLSLFVLIVSLALVGRAIAFTGPTTGQSPGSGGGKFNVDSQGNIGFGTASPTPASTFNSTSTESGPSGFGYVFIVASTTNPGVGLKNITSGNTYIWSSRNFGNFQLYRESGSLPGYVVIDINQYGEVAIGQRATSTGAAARLFVGGNVQATGAFVGSLSGSLSAANVSSDVFGRLQGNGNFAFPASLGVGTSSQNGLPQELSVYGDGYFSGSVGIGTANPIYGKLSVQSDGSGSITNALNLHNGGASANGTGSKIRFTALRALGDIQDFTYINSVVTDNTTSFEDGRITLGTMVQGTLTDTLSVVNGNVGIGTTSPQNPLDVVGVINASGNIRSTITSGEAFTDTSATTGALAIRLGNSGNSAYFGTEGATNGGFFTGSLGNATVIYSTGAIQNIIGGMARTIIDTSGNVGIATTTPQAKLHVLGDMIVSATTTISGNWRLAGASQGSLNMGAQSYSDIVGVDKLTVTTIDPLYNIGGKKYATYVSSIVGGVKEEYIGKGKISSEKEYVIDLNKVDNGSDIWVWRKAVDFSKENVDVFITPYGGFANIYYEVVGNKIIFHGDRETEFSYRLIGKRFDWRDHPTFAKDQNEATTLIVK